MDVKVGGSLARANRDDLDKLLDVQKELDIPVRVDTYMMPATRERELPYNMQSRLEPEEAARARIHALKREMGPEMFPQYAQQSVDMADHPKPGEAEPGHMSCMAGQCSFTINWREVQYVSYETSLPDLCGKRASGDGKLRRCAGLYVPVCGRVFEITENRMGEDTEWTAYFRSVILHSGFAARMR